MRILVTGSAGFIGYHVSLRLLQAGHDVTGFDGLTPYYDVALKQRRHAMLSESAQFRAFVGLLEDRDALDHVVAEAEPELIIHLAAQAGVRYSLEHPEAYVSANLVGTYNLLEVARQSRPRHLLFASTSSVYGGNAEVPYRETDPTRTPMSLYAATKSAGEAMTHAYAHLWGIPTTCFRFFTVYGPWGRPDMAPSRFVTAIGRGEPIEVYGHGRMQRDFTYVDDVAEAVERLLEHPPEQGRAVVAAGVTDSLSPVAPWRVVNIAGGHPVGLLEFIAAIERELGRQAIRRMLPMQKGDVPVTHADAGLLRALTGYMPATSLAEGVRAFVAWWRSQQ